MDKTCCKWCGHRVSDHRGGDSGQACICTLGLVGCPCEGDDPVISVTVEELAYLIERSDREHTVECGYRNGKVRETEWVRSTLASR